MGTEKIIGVHGGYFTSVYPESPDEDAILDVDWEEEENVYNVYMSYMKHYVVSIAGMKADGDSADNIVLLDTCASVGIFRDNSLFFDIRTAQRPVYIDGVNRVGKPLLVTKEGDTPFGVVYYSPDAAANVLSCGGLTRTGFSVTLDCGGTRFKVSHASTHQEYIFHRRDDNLYSATLRTDCGDERVYVTRTSLYETVEENKKKYTKREIKAAEEARRLQWKLGLPSTKEFVKMLNHGKILGTSVLSRDVQIAQDIYGPAVGAIRGKTTNPTPMQLHFEPVSIPQHAHQVLYVDIVFFNKLPFLVSVAYPLEFVSLTSIRAKSIDQLITAIKSQLIPFRQQKFIIDVMNSDEESAICSQRFKDRCDIRVEESEDAVGVIERKLRTLKERARGIKCTLPYKLMNGLLIWLVKYVTGRVNSIPTSNSEEYLSPREKLLNRKLDYKKDLKHGFGDFVEVFIKSDNSMEPRTVPALALMPTGALDGAWYYYRLEKKTVIRRRKAIELPMPQHWIDHLNELAQQKKQLNDDIEVMIGGTALDEDDEEPAINEQIDTGIRWVLPSIDPDSPHADNGDIDVQLDEEDKLDQYRDPSQEHRELVNEVFGSENEQVDLEIGANKPASSVVIDVQPDEDTPVPEPPQNGTSHEYNLRRERRTPSRYSVFNMRVNDAIAKYGQDIALRPIIGEMKQVYIDEKVMHAVHLSSLTPQEIAEVMYSKLFLREKFYADGKFEKIKGRFVAGGDKQKTEDFDDLYSPTVATAALFMLAALGHKNKRNHATADVPGAFLRVKYPKGPGIKRAFVRVNKFLSKILCDLDHALEDFLNADGTLIMELDKALYGCKLSSKLWYEEVSKQMETLGYKKNVYDKCTFNRGGTTVLVWVDDFFIDCDGLEMSAVKADLQKVFPGINITEAEIVNYLGMTFDFTDPDGVRITAPKFVEDFLKEYEDVTGIATTPAQETLFKINKDALQLNDNRRKRYHTCTCKLLYLSKRTRPDILLPIAFLASRVQKPTSEDECKLHRTVRYLRGTRDLGVKLSADSPMIQAYIDAAHAVHENCRSHTGAVLTLGKGPILVKSQRQGLNSRSSTESELIAVSDAITHVIWCRNWLIAQGYPDVAAKVFQDNKSTIALLEAGESNSTRTKHISSKYFFAHDRIKSGDIKPEFVGTENMWADIETKPLQGNPFYRLREKLLNWVVPEKVLILYNRLLGIRN